MQFAVIFRKHKEDAESTGVNFEQGSDFWIGLLVTSSSPAAGRSIKDAGLRNLDGVYLTSVRHNGKIAHAVNPDFVISAGDVLFFSGVPDSIEDVASKHGLLPFNEALETIDASDLPNLTAAYGVKTISVPSEGEPTPSGKVSDDGASTGLPTLELVEATIKKGADLAGQTIRAASFRSRFNAAVVAIKRDGIPHEWKGQIGDEVLLAGDHLLLDIDPQFWTTPAVNTNFENIGRSGQTKTHHEFMLPMRVGSYLSGNTIQKSGLRQLPSAFLVAVERGETTLHAVSPEEVLQEGDILWFATSASSVRFIRNTPGLTPLAEKEALKLRDTVRIERRLVQAIIGRDSPLIGRTPAEVHFRQQFNAAVVAVARQGERVRSKPGDIVLQSSDILLLDAGPGFANEHKQGSKYFSLVLELENTNPPRYFHTFICVALVATAFILVRKLCDAWSFIYYFWKFVGVKFTRFCFVAFLP